MDKIKTAEMLRNEQPDLIEAADNEPTADLLLARSQDFEPEESLPVTDRNSQRKEAELGSPRIPLRVLSGTSLVLSFVSTIGGIAAFFLVLNATIFSVNAPLHYLIDDFISCANNVAPVAPVKALNYEHLKHQVISSIQPGLFPRRDDDKLFSEISEEIKKYPQDLNYRELRSQYGAIAQNFVLDEKKMLISCGDAQILAEKRGTKDDWVSLAMLQARTGSELWRASLKKARALGFSVPKSEAAGAGNWVVACMHDTSYSVPHMLSWLEATSEITGDHSIDYFIAKTYLHCGQYQKAIDVYSKMIDEKTDVASVSNFYLMRGACYRFLGNEALAREDFQACLKAIGPEDGGLADFWKLTAKAALGEYVAFDSPEGMDRCSRVLFYVLSERYNDAVEQPIVGDHNPKVDADWMDCDRIPFLEQEANVHLLRAIAFEKLDKPTEAAAERAQAINVIPAPVRQEVGI